MCLAQGHKEVTPVKLLPGAAWSPTKHSTTEPLCSEHRYEEQGWISSKAVQDIFVVNMSNLSSPHHVDCDHEGTDLYQNCISDHRKSPIYIAKMMLV